MNRKRSLLHNKQLEKLLPVSLGWHAISVQEAELISEFIITFLQTDL